MAMTPKKSAATAEQQRAGEPQKLRNYRNKSRKGCMTCRKRHLKCDEARPHCLKCESSGRKCEYLSWNKDGAWVAWTPDGQRVSDKKAEAVALAKSLAASESSSSKSSSSRPSSSSSSSSPPPPSATSSPPAAAAVVASTASAVPARVQWPMGPSERRCVDLFLKIAYPNSRFYFGTAYWHRQFFYGACIHPEMQQLMVAAVIMSTNFRRMAIDAVPEAGSGETHAMMMSMKAYNKGLRMLRSSVASAQSASAGKNLDASTRDLLLACTTFFNLLEKWYGDEAAALHHVESTIRVLRLTDPEVREQMDQEGLHNYKVLDLEASTFHKNRIPIFSSPAPITPAQKSPDERTTVDDARSELTDIGLRLYTFLRQSADLIRYGQTAATSRASAYPVMLALQAELHEWRDHWRDFLANPDHPARRILIIIHTHLEIVAANSIEQEECLYDKWTDSFRIIVEQAEKLWIKGRFHATDATTLLPVYIAALKCRQPDLRRRALALLDDHDLQEGCWSAPILRHVARWVVETEDALAKQHGVGDGGVIPEDCRVHRVDFQKRKEGRQVRLTMHCTYRPSGEENMWDQLSKEVVVDVI